jgi:hypothetical protein
VYALAGGHVVAVFCAVGAVDQWRIFSSCCGFFGGDERAEKSWVSLGSDFEEIVQSSGLIVSVVLYEHFGLLRIDAMFLHLLE